MLLGSADHRWPTLQRGVIAALDAGQIAALAGPFVPILFEAGYLMYSKAVLTFALVAMLQGSSNAKPITSYDAPYVCNYAKIYHLTAGHYVNVRSGPSPQSPIIDKLEAGTVVYTCDAQGDWDKVFYRAANGSCGMESSDGLDVRKTAHCKTGWIIDKWIDILSG